jgi:NAD+ kinase
MGYVMKNAGILYNPMLAPACQFAVDLELFLKTLGLKVWRCSAWEGDTVRCQVSGSDLIVTVGGDGTILRAAQAVVPLRTPIVGINMGKLGFMTELGPTEAREKLPALVHGGGWIDERAMLEVTVAAEGVKAQEYYALNDVVLARGAIARIVHIAASVDGEPLTTYRADGVVVSTATGSTGYSLAAGGPILPPGSREFLLVPILPHLGLTYPMVFPDTSGVRLCLTTTHQAIINIDGHINQEVPSGTVVNIRHSACRTRFLRVHARSSFYSALEQKLKGK